MSQYSKLMQRIHAGECILIDGATGTEIERRGVPQLDNAWDGGGLRTFSGSGLPLRSFPSAIHISRIHDGNARFEFKIQLSLPKNVGSRGI